jgi:hypothetical protein
MGKSAQDIYATALTILQVGQPTIRLPPNPDFNSLSPEEKNRIYQDLHNQVDSLVPQRKSFAYKALSWGDTGPALESGLAIQKFVIAFVCRFQVILHQGGRKPVHIKMTLFGLYLIHYQPHLSIFESF